MYTKSTRIYTKLCTCSYNTVNNTIYCSLILIKKTTCKCIYYFIYHNLGTTRCYLTISYTILCLNLLVGALPLLNTSSLHFGNTTLVYYNFHTYHLIIKNRIIHKVKSVLEQQNQVYPYTWHDKVSQTAKAVWENLNGNLTKKRIYKKEILSLRVKSLLVIINRGRYS